MQLVFEIVVSFMIVVGAVFALVGSIGLAKLPDVMTRLHGPTKATTLGVGGVLIASMVYFALFDNRLSVHELLITLFLFLSAPVSANQIAKAHFHSNSDIARSLPPPPGQYGWATFDLPPIVRQMTGRKKPPTQE